jgi:hypothetical protein
VVPSSTAKEERINKVLRIHNKNLQVVSGSVAEKFPQFYRPVEKQHVKS